MGQSNFIAKIMASDNTALDKVTLTPLLVTPLLAAHHGAFAARVGGSD